MFPPVSKVAKDTLRKLSNMNEDESNAFLLGLLGKCEKVRVKAIQGFMFQSFLYDPLLCPQLYFTQVGDALPLLTFSFYMTLCCVNNSPKHRLVIH